MQLSPPTPTDEALMTGFVAWAGTLAVVLVLGLAGGVWQVTSALTQLVSFGVISALGVLIGAMLLIVIPVAAYLRLGLQLPLLGVVGYFAFWFVSGIGTGSFAGGLFQALIASPVAVLALPVVIAAEFLIRAHLLDQSPPDVNGRQ